jgi:hypothetical protein
VHLRRALLLFAIVLALAAVAASVSRRGDESRDSERNASPPPTQSEPTVSPGSSGQPSVTLRFDAARDQTRRLETGRAATLEVSVDEPGQVEIPLLGLASPAEPVTPARFEILASETRRYPIDFTPATADESLPAGVLVVIPPRQ